MKNNLAEHAFGGTKNALILARRLQDLDDGHLTWKLKKRFSKTMATVRCVEQIDAREIREYLLLLIMQDTGNYLDTLALPKDIRDRFLAAIRNQCLRTAV